MQRRRELRLRQTAFRAANFDAVQGITSAYQLS
nr:MAG TPA: hypothetical protein [Caudoviricetes sp.]DAV45767.1 MAG TPA: hypothetical protein [Caudoviricetes sp.]DAY78981.1 MAG TPA: hypothetical protein [Caudoviricetes sp.]